MDVLTRQRAIVKSKLTSTSKFLDNILIEPTSLSIIKARIGKLDEIWTEYDKIQTEIQLKCAVDQIEVQQEERDAFETRYFIVKGSLDKIVDDLEQPTIPSSSTSGSHQPTSQVKLPKLDLPTFSGNYTDWTSFYDLFRVLVHDNNTLSDVQKLQYLKGCLRGEAVKIIQALQVTEANYTEAWKLLKERYDNKRQIISAHYKALISQPVLHSVSASGLRGLLDNFLENMRSLSVLQADLWDSIMIHLFTDRMDNESRRLWEMSLIKTELPVFSELKSFVQQRCQALEATTSTASVKNETKTSGQRNHCGNVNKSKPASAFYSSPSGTCVICSGCHPIYQCDKFLKLTPEERSAAIKKYKLCFNCLRDKHTAQQCSSGDCRKCGGRHHTLLHFKSQVSTNVKDDKSLDCDKPSTSAVFVSHQGDDYRASQVLLPTVIVKVIDYRGATYQCRALLDSGSQANFVTESLTDKLRLKKVKQRVPVRGIGATGATQSCGIVNLNIQSSTSSFNLNISAIILPRITDNLPASSVNPSDWEHLKEIQLADPTFYKMGEVDMLLGADVFSQVIKCGKITGNIGGPTAHSTEFGWIVSGSCGQSRKDYVTSHLTVLPTTEVEQQLRRFWELEECKSVPALSLEDKRCEEHFEATTSRDSTGRFIVELPFKEESGNLGDSKKQAIFRLNQLEKKFLKFPDCKEQYVNFLKEYEDLGHMEKLSDGEIRDLLQQGYYLPHHCVLKNSSSSTKLRVVFDASAASSSGISLNDKLMSGPTVQQDMISILVRFRTHKVVFTTDIKKMFRQVLIHPKHQGYQRILWRDSPMEGIQEFKLKTVTYGITSSPYLATRALKQLASEAESSLPLAAKTVLDDFYMDDCMSGADTTAQVLELQQQLIQLLNSGGFELHKWSSNNSSVLEAVPRECREDQITLPLFTGDTIEAVKTLGILWSPNMDYFSFQVHLESQNKVTKRSVLSDIARLFDPLGWIAPVVIVAKVMLQKLWVLGLSWDQELPEEMSEQWKDFKAQLHCLDQLKIQRFLGTFRTHQSSIQLHGFCDSSEVAYAAVVYLRSENEAGNVKVNMVCSKTKVAPLKQVSLPRLELCAAVLLGRLIKFVKQALQLKIRTVHAWTDSSITLAWIRGHPKLWKTFVANRVSEIQDIVPPEDWHHVGSQENPADCATRGLTPLQLTQHSIWWKGPNWLHSLAQLPQESFNGDKEPLAIAELRKAERTCLTTTTTFDMDLLQRCSTFSKLIRVSAFVQTFIHNCKVKKEQRRSGFLTCQELHNAVIMCIKNVQLEVFGPEISALQESRGLSGKSRLHSFSPFVDSSGCLRVGGRLGNSNLSFHNKHPLLLPKTHRLTELIVIHEHVKQLHAGPTLMLSILRQRYWIINGRDTIRRVIHKCLVCVRNRARVNEQLMGQLPAPRVKQVRPFLVSGVDYAGPVNYRATTGRGRFRVEKCYISLFICFSVKAIHLELVTDLSTEAFLAALRRFVARRGRCSDIYCDCGSNFIGADRELRDLSKLMKSEDHNQKVGCSLAKEDIK